MQCWCSAELREGALDSPWCAAVSVLCSAALCRDVDVQFKYMSCFCEQSHPLFLWLSKRWDQETLASFWGRIPPTQCWISSKFGAPPPAPLISVSCCLSVWDAWLVSAVPETETTRSLGLNKCELAWRLSGITMSCIYLFLFACVDMCSNTIQEEKVRVITMEVTVHHIVFKSAFNNTVYLKVPCWKQICAYSGASTPPTNPQAKPLHWLIRYHSSFLTLNLESLHNASTQLTGLT